MVDRIRILSRDEITAVLAELHRELPRRRRGLNTQMNLAIFRLACCCGLRVKEICGLRICDIAINSTWQVVLVPANITKGHRNRRTGEIVRRPRVVPLSWDDGTLRDLGAWREVRLSQGGGLRDPLICGQSVRNAGRRLTTSLVALKWKSAIKVLSPDRVRQLSIHCGRHSFITHAIYGGVPIVDVSKAAGHASIATTNGYTHLLDVEAPRNIFRFEEPSLSAHSHGADSDMAADNPQTAWVGNGCDVK